MMASRNWPDKAQASEPANQFAPGDRSHHSSSGLGAQTSAADSRDRIVVPDFEDKPFLQDLLEHGAALLRRLLIRPDPGEPLNTPKASSIGQGFVSRSLHRLLDIACEHRLIIPLWLAGYRVDRGCLT